MNTDFENESPREELIPPMPPAFSEAVDTAVFTAIRRENEKKQSFDRETEREKRQAPRRQRMRRMLTAAAAVVLLMITAFTAGLGLAGRNAATATTGKGEDDSQRLNDIPLFDSTFPEVVRYDLTRGYPHTDTLLNLVQEQLSFLNEKSYDELWLLAVADLSDGVYDKVVYTGNADIDPDQRGWTKATNLLFALVQFEFEEEDGPMLVECTLDDAGKPVTCKIKALSCDPELDGRYYRNIVDSTSPAVYVGYGTDASRGQITCGKYVMDFTCDYALSLAQIEARLENSNHREHARAWYLYTAPAKVDALQLYTSEGKEKTLCTGATAQQAMNSSAEASLRVTLDGETYFTAGYALDSSLTETEREYEIQSQIRLGDTAWHYTTFPTSFLLQVERWKSHTMTLDTNLPDMKVKETYLYQNKYIDGESQDVWSTEVPQTVKELLKLEPDEDDRIFGLLVESQGQEYIFTFCLRIYDEADTVGTSSSNKQDMTFTPGAVRYDLTGGYARSEGILDGAEALLQAKGIAYEEVWLEAVFDFNEYPYDILEKRYGLQEWMPSGAENHGIALVQYDFSEGAGPMLVNFYYNSKGEVTSVWMKKETVPPDVDTCAVRTDDEPYAIPDKCYCVGSGARSGRISMSVLSLPFTSQLPLEQVQELVKDSPYKDAAREWYLLATPAKGTAIVYDANGQLLTDRTKNILSRPPV